MRLQVAKGIQAEMASVMAAAVHQGWIPIEELLDLLDGAADSYNDSDHSLATREQEWASWVVQHYLHPSMAGAQACCSQGFSCKGAATSGVEACSTM